MGTQAEHSALAQLVREGRMKEARVEMNRLWNEHFGIGIDIDIVSPVVQSPENRTSVKFGVAKPVRSASKTAEKLATIILRETGQKIGCSNCTSEIAKLNRISAADTLIQIESIADKIVAMLKEPVEKTRVKAWICEAVEGAT